MAIFPRAVLLFRFAVLVLLLFAGSAHGQWRELDWLELMPEEDLRLLESLPQIEHEGDGPVELPDEIMTGRVVPEMDGVEGACIHVPPPPPNQIIHVTYKPGFTLGALYEPVWVQGTLKTESVENDIAAASYTLVSEEVELYEMDDADSML